MKIIEIHTGIETWLCEYCDKKVQISTRIPTPKGKGPKCGPHWDDTGRRVYYKMVRLTHSVMTPDGDMEIYSTGGSY